MNALVYRPEIDGLRAIAVLAVVLYHANIPGFGGGFVGVDVFFVISGYLICSIILRDVANGSFSLMHFWERRARRILPALVVLLVCSAFLSYVFVLYSQDFKDYGKSLQLQGVFLSNVFFMHKTDSYFDPFVEYQPLLHTWTLSVEEQFYIVFPVLVLVTIWLVRRRVERYTETESTICRYSLRWLVVVFATISFAYSTLLVNIAPDSYLALPFLPDILATTKNSTAGFYLLFSRAWELAVGVLLALTLTSTSSIRGAEWIGAAGSLAIIISITCLSQTTPFPGISALLPTLGTAAVLAANTRTRTRIGNYLSSPLMMWFGVISYSLYLWHWPLLVFARTSAIAPLNYVDTAAIVALSIAIAWLSYRFVETPVRKREVLRSQKSVMLFTCISLMSAILFGTLINRTEVAQHRVPAAALKVALATDNINPRRANCFSVAPEILNARGPCLLGEQESISKPMFVLWGDSHSDAIMPLFDMLATSFHVSGAYFGQSACVPIIGVFHAGAAQVTQNATCKNTKEQAMKYVQTNNIKYVFLVARWTAFVNGPSIALLSDEQTWSRSPTDAADVFERNLNVMVKDLSARGVKVYLVRQVAEQPEYSTRTAFYQAVRTGKTVPLKPIPIAEHITYQMKVNEIFDRISKLPNVFVLDPAQILCGMRSMCEFEMDGERLYWDQNHINNAGAMKLEPLFRPIFDEMLSTSTSGS